MQPTGHAAGSLGSSSQSSRARRLMRTVICLMSAPTRVVSAILGFDDWSYPWRFAASVTESLGAADARLFEEVWAEAGDEKHWLQATDLPSGAKAASESLTTCFPWLPPEAVKALANAAAYQWR